MSITKKNSPSLICRSRGPSWPHTFSNALNKLSASLVLNCVHCYCIFGHKCELIIFPFVKWTFLIHHAIHCVSYRANEPVMDPTANVLKFENKLVGLDKHTRCLCSVSHPLPLFFCSAIFFPCDTCNIWHIRN